MDSENQSGKNENHPVAILGGGITAYFSTTRNHNFKKTNTLIMKIIKYSKIH
jgi:hypothetical protein